MNNKYKRTILDIEPLLKEKTFEELNAFERDFLMQHLGSEAQIKQYQKMLQCCEKAVVISPQLRPKSAIQARLRKKVEARSAVKNSFEGLFIALGSLFAMRAPLRSGIALAMLTLTFWVSSNMEQGYYNNFDALQDSIYINSIHQADISQPSETDSNTIMILPKKMNAGMGADSFARERIRRR